MSDSRDVDGGWAWVVLFGTFLAVFLNGFMCYSIGVLTSAMLDVYGEDIAKTSAVGSLVIAVECMAGPVVGLIINRIGCRTATFIGGILCVIGMAGASVSASLNMVLLTFGVLVGFGLGLGYIPALVVVGHYFHRLRPFASGVTVAGGGLGMITGPPLVRLVLDNYGLSGTFLIMGAVLSHFCAIGLLMRISPVEINVNKTKMAKTRNRKSTSDKRHLLSFCCRKTDHRSFLEKARNKTFAQDKVKDQGSTREKLESQSFLPTTENSGNSAQKNGDCQRLEENGTKGRDSLLGKVKLYESNGDVITDHKNNVKQSCDVKTKIKKKKSRASECFSTFTKGSFVCFIFSIAAWNAGEAATLVLFPNYIQQIGFSKQHAASLYMAMGLANIPSRLLTGYAANDENISGLTLLSGQMGLAAILTVTFPYYSHSHVGQVLFVIGLGLYISGANSLMSPITVELLGLPHLATGFGFVMLMAGVGYLSGAPIAGMIVDATGSYSKSYLFAGSLYFLSSVLALSCALSQSFHEKTVIERNRTLIIEQNGAVSKDDLSNDIVSLEER